MQQLSNLYTLTALRTLTQQEVLKEFPVSGSITAEQLSSKTGMQLELLRRLLRLLIVSQFLVRDDEGRYSHTRISRLSSRHEPVEQELPSRRLLRL